MPIGCWLLGGSTNEVTLSPSHRRTVRSWLAERPETRAYLDVQDPEPPPEGDPLLTLPNARLLPHLASRTSTAMARMSDVVEDIWAVLEGSTPNWPAPDP